MLIFKDGERDALDERAIIERVLSALRNNAGGFISFCDDTENPQFTNPDIKILKDRGTDRIVGNYDGINHELYDVWGNKVPVGDVCGIERDPLGMRQLFDAEGNHILTLTGMPSTDEKGRMREIDLRVLSKIPYEEWIAETGIIDDKNRIVTDALVRLAKANFCYDRECDDYYRYDGEIWQHIPKDLLIESVRDLVREEYTNGGGRVSRTVIEAVLRGIRNTPTPQCTDARYKGNLTGWTDGIYNADTGELLPFDRSVFQTKKYTVARYGEITDDTKNLNKLCEFIERIHQPEDLDFVWKLFGYILFHGGTAKRVIYLSLGQGGTGKSKEQQILARILGDVNVCSKRLTKLSRPFDAIDLRGKQLYLGGEISADDKTDQITSILKALTGDDLIEGETKGVQTKIQFRNTAVPMFASNEIPNLNMDSGLEDRLFIVSMNTRLDTLGEEWEDLDGILNDPDMYPEFIQRCHGGFTELRNDGYRFHRYQSRSMEANLRMLTTSNDPFEAFISAHNGGTDREILEIFCPNGEPRPVEELAEMYRNEGYTKYGQSNKFSKKAIERYGHILSVQRITIDGRRTKCFTPAVRRNGE